MRLDQYLEEKGESSSDFAKRVKLSRSGISRLLSGQRIPSLAVAIDIKNATAGRVQPNDWMQRPPAKKKPTADERFDALWQLEPTTGCHVWTNHCGPPGYGHFMANGKRMMAHRYAYERKHGPIADGLDLDHLCRRPSCVNPAHLEAVTPKENFRRSEHPTARAMRKKRA